jgi:hypothetical protein
MAALVLDLERLDTEEESGSKDLQSELKPSSPEAKSACALDGCLLLENFDSATRDAFNARMAILLSSSILNEDRVDDEPVPELPSLSSRIRTEASSRLCFR